MIRKANECSIKVNEHMKGGDGHVTMTSFISGPEELQNKGRLFSLITLEPGCGIGYHVHEKESELFYLVKGSATYNDGGIESEVSAGDVTIVAPGQGHGISNHGSEVCELVAVIVNQ
jgi:quercetin dioxygenase-like cupin family protein